jgi:hypothetical protein
MSYSLPLSPTRDNYTERLAHSFDKSLVMPLALGALVTLIIVASIVTHSATVAFALLLVFIIGVIYGAMTNIHTAIAWYLAYAAVEGMYKVMTDFSQAIYVIKPLLAVIILVGWALNNHRRGVRPKALPLVIIIILFLAWGMCETLNPLGSGLVPSIVTWLIWYTVPLSFFVVGYNTLTTTKQVVKLLYVLLAVSTVVSAFAFVEYMMGRAWTLVHVPGYHNLSLAMWIGADSSGHKVISFRPASTTSSEGFGTLWSNIGTVTALGLTLLPKVSLPRKIVLFLCVLVNIGGLIVSGVRLYVGISILEVVLLFILTSVSPRLLMRNLLLTAIVLGLAFAGFTASQDISNGAIASRYAATFANPYQKFSQERDGGFVGQALWVTDFLAQHPLGIGYQRGMSGDGGKHDRDSGRIIVNRETQYAATSDDMGIPGLCLLLIIIGAMLTRGASVFRRLRLPQFKILGVILFISLIGYTLGYSGGQMFILMGDYIWLYTAFLFALPALERQEIARRTAMPDRAGAVTP